MYLSVSLFLLPLVEWSSAVEARSYTKKRMVNYPLVFFLYSTHVHRDKQKDLYGILGVTPSATQAQIKAAFYDLSRTHHPGLNHSHTVYTTRLYSGLKLWGQVGIHDVVLPSGCLI